MHLQELMNLVSSGRRSSLSWFSSAKNSNFFCGRSYETKFWEIISIPSSICLPQGNLLSPCICWHLKFVFWSSFTNLAVISWNFEMWISCKFAWSEITWFTWIDALFLEICRFCCSRNTLSCVENHPLNTFRWLHIRGYATTYVILISLLLVSELRRWAVPIACVI